MTLDIDLGYIDGIEFGIGRKAPAMFSFVAVHLSTKAVLQKMVQNTVAHLERSSEKGRYYQASEKYESTEYCYLDIGDPLGEIFRDVASASNLPSDSEFPRGLDTVTCYFARLTDRNGRQLTAFRRATQFKALRKPIILRWLNGQLLNVDDSLFKLDADFDLLVDSKRLHVLRPRGFEAIGHLNEAILSTVQDNVDYISERIPNLDLTQVKEYAGSRIRAARYLASIKQEDLERIDVELLVRHCADTGIEMKDVNGRLAIANEDIMSFLEVMDRRRFAVELVRESQKEVYRAGSRRRIGR